MPERSRPPRDEEEPEVRPPAEAVAGPRPPPGPVYLRPGHLYKAVLLLLGAALLYRYWTGVTQVLLIAYAAAVLAVAFNVVVHLFPAGRRWLTALLGLVVVGVVGLALWYGAPVVVSEVRSFSASAPAFQQQIERWEQSLEQSTGINVDILGDQTRGWVQSTFVGSDGQNVLGRARSLVEILAVPLLVFFGALFAVGAPNDRLLSPTLRAAPRDLRPAVERIYHLLGRRLLGWVKGTLISMAIVGVLTTVTLYLLGVPYALLLGMVAGLAEVVPLVGPWVAGIVATGVALFQDPQLALWTALAMLAIQQLESNLITPLVMSRAAEVHPFITLFAILFFGTLFGPLGVLLSLPLVLLVWTVVQVLWVERAIDTDRDRIEPVVEE